MVHPQDLDLAVQAWKDCYTKKEMSTSTYRIRNVDGVYKWHEVTQHFDNEINCVWWVGMPMEAPLVNNISMPVREVADMYWQIIEAAAYPIITIDDEGLVFMFNQSAQEMFMYSPMEVVGTHFSEIIKSSSGTIADATGSTVRAFAKRRNGTTTPVSMSVGQFQQFGRCLYVLALQEAESEMKLEEELHKSKDSFLSNMSHELRTPLFGLLGTMSVMQIPEDPILQTELKQMQECTWHLLSMVNNMLDLYKLNNLTVSPVPQVFQPHTLIADLCSTHSICVNEGVALNYEVSSLVPSTLVADVSFLQHAVSNVLGNAVRFTHTGAVNALVSAGGLTEEGKFMLNFTVSDSGIGIHPDFFPKMFQPFTQRDLSDSRQYGGLGLGLAVSKNLIDLMGGTIRFTSELGKGSEFVVSVPVSVPKEETSEPIEEVTVEYTPTTCSPPIELQSLLSLFTNVSTSSPKSSPASVVLEAPRTSNSNAPMYFLSDSCDYSPSTSPLFLDIEDELYPTERSISPPLNETQTLNSPIASPTCSSLDFESFDVSSNSSTNSRALSRGASLPSLFELQQDQYPSDWKSFVPKGRVSWPNINTSFAPGTPSADSLKPFFGLVPEPNYFLHPSLCALLLPSPSSSIPIPYSRFSPSGSPSASPYMSPSASPPRSPSMSPRASPCNTPLDLDESYPILLSSSSSSSSVSLSASLSSSPTSSPATFSSSSPSSAISISPALSSSMKVLVVEDNPVNQNIIKRMLQKAGWEVTIANHGQDALDILFDADSDKFVGYSMFNVILMDCQMPVLDGYQATREIRKHEESLGQHKRIVAITASTQAEDQKKCFEAGMDAFVTKPLSPQTLFNTMTCQD